MSSAANVSSTSLANNPDEYQFDAFEDGSSKLVGEQQLTKLNQFAVDYAQQIWHIEEALDESLSDTTDFNIDPVSLYIRPYEQQDIIELIKTEHKIFNKVMLVFSSLTNQVRILKETAELRFFQPLIVFGEITGEASEGDVQVEVGRLLPFMIDLSAFVNRCYAITRNIVSQLASCYQAQANAFSKFFKNIHLQSVFYALSDLFSVLITLDQIVVQNQALASSWGRFQRMVKSVRAEPGKYGVAEEDRLWQLEKLLLSLKGQLLEGYIYQACITQEFDFPGVVDVKNNKVLKAEFGLNVKSLFSLLQAKIMDPSELYLRERFPGMLGLYTFFISLFKDITDKSFFKQVWELTKRVPMVSIYTNVIWYPADFIVALMPGMIKSVVGNPDIQSVRRDYLKIVDKEFAPRVKSYYLQVSRWMVRMESGRLNNRGTFWDANYSRIGQIIQGILLSYHISHLFKTMIGLHMSLTAPLKPSDVRRLFQCAELLKSIQGTFHRRSAMISAHISLMTQQLTQIITNKLDVIRAKYTGKATYTDTELDVIMALTLTTDLLSGVATPERLTIVKLCLNVIYQINVLKDPDIEELRLHIKRLEFISDIHASIRRVCDCSLLFWARDLFPTYLTYIYDNPSQANSLQYTLTGMKDVVSILEKAIHVEHPSSLIDVYRNELEEMVEKSIINPLGKDIETDLRLRIHAFLNVEEKDPFKSGIREFGKFLELKPLRFFDKTIDIKSRIEHYLDSTFYNLNTVSLFDWKTYSEMRNMAFYKYGLNLLEVHLPGATLEQGLDVLEIMRNIHIFVARYNYNLNNQIFIQRSSNSKTLNTINITHIANSIRTHGAGIMNTTVNFAFQYLKQKFGIFSEFLFDDHIKSRLYKNIKYFRENKAQLDSMYPYELAIEFEKDLRQLGLTEAGQSFLDQFRVLVTNIGNAMGYIRLVRSGGLLYTSNAIKFVPDLKKIPNFEELVNKHQLSGETQNASKNLDNVIENLSANVSEGTEYFKMLVTVFATEFRSLNNQHLRNFYAIVPPLTINFVEHIINAKDKLFKKSKAIGAESLQFTDDGFAIGLAYILKLLDQNKEFDSLHWFERVTKKHQEDQERILKEGNIRGLKEDQNQLAIKKVKNMQQEFELFRYSFSGARIFFKD
ncbi:hypothetical protein SAMD00019534_015940 [Acytostelium subglobosum LB1]|uniref:hypothetical protein n=1 Tax=Acytostelium subglobosum LB1 TaxID=1410327 RepID=UPI000644FF7C|nr:hypothetical protein SAMD00019534_015940 [Acytostelium subglobosum LB1]GAM18419.1 hypothetical protein SAMD00019534_015940 [Acytostelium subglobosum LB1]|eukprot:XP_012757639.1 hypothetical protein SAMD00019534_015940 [Acytostelium subglobosum LB1]